MFAPNGPGIEERAQIIAFLEEYCRGMTLQDVREWYFDACTDHVSASPHVEGMCLNTP